jgi:uncharacterized membrane protein YcaP (DUF421 family)
MAPWLEDLLGERSDLDPGQMAVRAVVVFFLTLFFVRVSGRRSFAQHGPFDVCVTVLLGAILSRAIVGASSFWSTVAAAAVIVLLHRLVALASIRWNWVEDMVNGHTIVLVRNGRVDEQAMREALVTREDLDRSMREQIASSDLAQVRRAILEKNGHLSIVRRR